MIRSRRSSRNIVRAQWSSLVRSLAGCVERKTRMRGKPVAFFRLSTYVLLLIESGTLITTKPITVVSYNKQFHFIRHDWNQCLEISGSQIWTKVNWLEKSFALVDRDDELRISRISLYWEAIQFERFGVGIYAPSPEQAEKCEWIR